MRKIVFWLIIIIFVASFSIYRNIEAGKAEVGSKQILALVDGAVKARQFSSPIDHYKLYRSGKKLIGYVVRTAKIEPQFTGYGGEIDCLVGIDLNGKITGVEIYSHNESPDYFPIVLNNGLLKRMIGLSGSEVERLDATTSATISSAAIINDVSAAVESAVRILIGKDKSSFLDYEKASGDWTPYMIFIPLIAGGIAIFDPKKKYLRAVSLILSFIIVGILMNTPLTIGNVVDMAGGSFFLTGGVALISLMAAAIVIGFFKGPFYCTYICPFGAVQEGAHSISRRDVDADRRLIRRLSYIRYLFVIGVAVSLFLFGMVEFRLIEPFSRCFSAALSKIALIQAGVVVFFSFFIRRVWCRFFCPTGLFMEMISELGGKVRKAVGDRW